MNASTSRGNRLDSTGRKAHAASTLGALLSLAASIAFMAPVENHAAAQEFGGRDFAAQEFIVSDQPASPPAAGATDGAVVGLPVEALPPDGLPGDSVLQEDPLMVDPLPLDIGDGAGLPGDLADGAMQLPRYDADEGAVFIDESGAAEYAITDDWVPQLARRPAPRHQRWTAQVDALFLFMGNVPDRPVYVDGATGLTTLNVKDGDPAMSAAPRYALIWHRDECRAFELNYFSVGAFEGIAERLAPPGTTFSSVGLGGVPFNDVIAAGLETTSGIKSWEFNLRKTNGGPVTWIAGFRWVEWTQQFVTADVFDDGVALGFDAYGVETGNNLYGGQLGADVMLWNRGDRIRINGLAKGGVYYNYQAWQRSRILSESAVLDASVGATKDTVSFVGEVGLVGEYRIFNWLSWRAGYTVFWLGGVANAANQLARSDFTVDPPTTGISPYSSVLLHGATTGLEARW